jgi:hypothetical protein
MREKASISLWRRSWCRIQITYHGALRSAAGFQATCAVGTKGTRCIEKKLPLASTNLVCQSQRTTIEQSQLTSRSISFMVATPASPSFADRRSRVHLPFGAVGWFDHTGRALSKEQVSRVQGQQHFDKFAYSVSTNPPRFGRPEHSRDDIN